MLQRLPRLSNWFVEKTPSGKNFISCIPTSSYTHNTYIYIYTWLLTVIPIIHISISTLGYLQLYLHLVTYSYIYTWLLTVIPIILISISTLGYLQLYLHLVTYSYIYNT